MSRLPSNKTTRPLLYSAIGSGILLALPPFALVLGTSPAQATTRAITQSFSAAVGIPARVRVALNGEAKCLPVVDQIVTATTSATISESESLHVADGAPFYSVG